MAQTMIITPNFLLVINCKELSTIDFPISDPMKTGRVVIGIMRLMTSFATSRTGLTLQKV